jgi:hypothetical protein
VIVGYLVFGAVVAAAWAAFALALVVIGYITDRFDDDQLERIERRLGL